MADKESEFVTGTGLLSDEQSDPQKNVLGLYPQTPKYFQDSSKTDRMARFFVADSLVAALEVFYSKDAANNYLINSLKNKGFFDFFLTSISDSSQDRYQLTETMGDNYVLYGFNKAPEILTCSGILKNTVQDDWKVQFLEFFKKIGGISSLAKFYNFPGNKTGATANYVSFKYDSVIKRGALLNVSHTITANSEMDIAFSFSFIVTKTITFSQDQKSININNVGTEVALIDGEASSIRTITGAGTQTLVAANTGSNTAMNKGAAASAKKAFADATPPKGSNIRVLI